MLTMTIITATTSAIAAAIESSRRPWKPTLYTCSSTGVVSPPRALGGPPPVISCGCPTSWKLAMIWRVTTSSRIGRRLGSVIERNCGQRFAPSTDAASYRSAEIPCIPARKMIVLKPIVHHRVAIRIEIHAHGLEASQFGPTPNRAFTARATKPALLLNIHHHTRAMTDTDNVQGTK